MLITSIMIEGLSLGGGAQVLQSSMRSSTTCEDNSLRRRNLEEEYDHEFFPMYTYNYFGVCLEILWQCFGQLDV